MATVADLRRIGIPVDDPIETARRIGGLILTRRQKAALLKDYLGERKLELTEEIRRAAEVYVEAL